MFLQRISLLIGSLLFRFLIKIFFLIGVIKFDSQISMREKNSDSNFKADFLSDCFIQGTNQYTMFVASQI